MRVLSIHRGCDTAGIGWLLSQAFTGDPNVTLRSAVRRTNWIGYPHDLDWSQAETEWARADVVHVHNSLVTWRQLGGGKPVVVHHHGTYYRDNADRLNREIGDVGGRAVVSTLDLLDHGDDLTWCPAPYDLDWLATFRRPQTGKLRVGHAPTDRSLKSTAAFLAACEWLDVEPVLIEGKTWQECLRMKGTCDVLFDQTSHGYGHNAIEAWGMGIPVIAGADVVTLERMWRRFARIPFYTATETTIGDAIRVLMDDGQRAYWTQTGLTHIRRWHDGTATRRVLSRLYRELLGKRVTEE